MIRQVFVKALFCLLLGTGSAFACSLKIDDLAASFSIRKSDTTDWEQQLEAVERSLSASAESIHAQMNEGVTCSADMTRQINESLVQLDRIEAASISVPRDVALARETDTAFECFADIAKRLGSARAKAVSAGEALKVQRYNAIGDKLSKLDRDYTTALVDAESARLRNARLRAMAEQYTELCSDDGF